MLPLALLLFSHPLLRTNRTSAYHIGTGAMGGRRWRWGEAQLKDENEDEDEMRRSFFLGLARCRGGGRRHTIAIDTGQEGEEEALETRRKMGDLGV